MMRSGSVRLARQAAIVVALIALLLAVAAWLQLRNALDDVSAARDAVADAEELARDGDVEAVLASVTEAERKLSEARATLRSSAPIRIARVLPGIRQNIDAAQMLADRAFDITASVRHMADAAAPLADTGVVTDEGAVDADLLGRIRDESSRIRAELESRELLRLPSAWLLSSRITDAAAELADGEHDYYDVVRSIDDGLGLVDAIVGGEDPRRWLIVAANAAEMRGAGGMVLSYAVLEGRDGTVSVSAVGHEETLNEGLTRRVDVALPPDYEVRYARYNLTGDIRNATLSGDFTVGGPIIEAVYEEATGESIDGVIQMDSMALARLLGVTGPVAVDDVGEVAEDTVVDLTLHELYHRYDDVDDRQDALSAVAAAVVDHLLDSGPDPLDLVDALQDSLHARNLMLYSRAPAVQERIQALGASGELPLESSVYLAVQNFSGNKLDYFIDTDLALTGQWKPGQTGEVTAVVTIANRAPRDATEPRYVYGPYDSTLVAGQYRAHVVLYLPAGATMSGDPPADGVSDVATGTENGRPVITFSVDVAAGESTAVELDIRAPAVDGCPGLTLVPSPRIRPTTAAVEIDAGFQALSFDGPLTDTEAVRVDC